MLIGNTPGSFYVGYRVICGLRGFSFEFRSLLPRPPYLDTDRLVGRSTITDFSEGTAFGTRCFVKQWPDLRRSTPARPEDSPGLSGPSQAPQPPLKPQQKTHHTLRAQTSTPYSSAKVSRACIVFWFKSWALLFASAFFFFSGTEAALSVVQQVMKFPEPRSYSVLLRCQRHCRITGRGCLRDAHSSVRNGKSVIPVTPLDDLNLCYSRNLGRSLVVLGRVAWLAVLPLTGQSS